MTNEMLKTGTTTIALKCKEGLVLAADKRATAGNMIANSNMIKVYEITDRIAMTVAGSVSDIQLIVKYIRAQMKLKGLQARREVTVKETANLLGSILYSSIRSFTPGIAHFLIGGMDNLGFHIYDLYPDGSVTEEERYLSSGSGSPMVYGVLETKYKEGITIKEGKELAIEAISAATRRDSASGDGIDLTIITNNGLQRETAEILKRN